MLNFNENWTETDINGPPIFTNVPIGKFVFEVKASNNDGIWNEVPTTIEVCMILIVWSSMILQIFIDHIICNIAIASTPISDLPKIPTPALLP